MSAVIPITSSDSTSVCVVMRGVRNQGNLVLDVSIGDRGAYRVESASPPMLAYRHFLLEELLIAAQ
jgi:hypothetical protein